MFQSSQKKKKGTNGKVITTGFESQGLGAERNASSVLLHINS